MNMQYEVLLTLRNPLVRAHRVEGRHVLPGLAYLDLLHQAFAHHGFNAAELELQDLAIHRPLIVGKGKDILLTIDCESAAQDEWRIEVSGQHGTKGTAAKTRHRYALATAQRAAAVKFDEVLDFDRIRPAALQVFPMQEVYAGSRRHGLVHDEFMQAQGHVYVTGDALYADCTLDGEARENAAALLFHPTLIDGCVVGLTFAASTLRDDEHRAALPFYFHSFRAAQLLRDACVARVLKSTVQARNELTYLTVEFFDAQGRKVAELKDFASKLLRQAGTFGAEDKAVAIAVEAHGQPAATPLDELRALIGQRVNRQVAQVPADANFYDIGLDSVAMLELTRLIEMRMGVALPPTLLFECTSARELADYLAARHPQEFQHLGQGKPGSAGQSKSAVAMVRKPAAASQAVSDIAIVGFSGRFPQASDLAEFWNNLRAGRDCIEEIPAARWNGNQYFSAQRELGKSCSKWGGFIDDVDRFDPRFFNMSPQEAEITDPQQRLFLETVWNLLEGSGCTRDSLRSHYGGRVGVYVGSMYNQYHAATADLLSDALSMSFQSGIANRVSHYFGLQGPSMVLDTACSSAAVAIHMAASDLRAGNCRLAIAGGVNLSIHPKKYLSLSSAELLGSNPQGRSFGDSDGYLPAETVAAVLLKPLEQAIADQDDILAVIKATATNHSGGANGFAVANPNAHVQLIEEVLERAQVRADSVSYVEAAASGSGLADAIEVGALKKVFGSQPGTRRCAIGAVKSNIGHAEAASVMPQLAKVILQLRHGELVPSIKAQPLNPHIRLEDSALHLQQELAKWECHEWPRRALINAFGAGGSNVSLLVEEYAAADSRPALQAGPQVAVFSARTITALRAVVRQMHDYIAAHSELRYDDIIHTLQVGREPMEHRLAVVVNDRDELLAALADFLDQGGKAQLHISGAADFEEPDEEALAKLLDARDLAALAQMWVKHVRIPWEQLRSLPQARRIFLPTYPFEKSRYWIGSGEHYRRQLQASTAFEQANHGDVRSFMTGFLARALQIPEGELPVSGDLRSYGVDSIVGLRLLRAVNASFGTALTGRIFLEHATLESLARYVEAQGHSQRTAEIKPSPVAADDATALKALRDFKTGALSQAELRAMLKSGSLG